MPKKILSALALGVAGLAVAVALTLGAFALAGQDIGRPATPPVLQPTPDATRSPGHSPSPRPDRTDEASPSPSDDKDSDDNSGPGSGSDDDNSGSGSDDDDHDDD
ncbi:MAG: hypothetical protein ACXWYN_01610 [Actinomycetota bacterium]